MPKNWCFWTVVLEKTLESPSAARRSNQLILKEINPKYSLKGLVLKLQYFGHLMQRTDSLEKTWCWERLKAGGEGDDSRWDGWMASPTRWTWVWASSGNCWRTGKPGMLQSIELQRVGHDWATELNWLLNHWKWGPCVLWEKVKEVKFGACNNSKLGYTVWDLPLFSLLPLVVDQKILSAGKCVIAIYYIQLFKYQLNTSQKPALVNATTTMEKLYHKSKTT